MDWCVAGPPEHVRVPRGARARPAALLTLSLFPPRSAEAITGEDFADPSDFAESTKDGVLLCKCVAPPPRRARAPTSARAHALFFRALPFSGS